MNGLKQRLTRTHPTGFSLLEVLVGLIILAIGLLGLAGMQMVSLRQNNDAYLRSQATLQAYDILDRMLRHLLGKPDNATHLDVKFQRGNHSISLHPSNRVSRKLSLAAS